MHRSLPLLSLLGILTGCSTDGGQTGDENTGPKCVPVSNTPLSEDEMSPAGFAASEILPLVAGQHASPLTWTDEGGPSYAPEHGPGMINLSVSPRKPDSIHWVDLEPNHESTLNIALRCPDHLEVEADFSVSTDGGALNEMLPAIIVAWDAAEAVIDVQRPLDAMTGSLIAELPSESQGSLRVIAGFSAAGTKGDLRLVIEAQKNGALSQQDSRIASW